MKRHLKILFLFLTFSLTSFSVEARMTDQQVLLYVKQARTQGKTQDEIKEDLISKGVTPEQINRLRKKYGGDQSIKEATTEISADTHNVTRAVARNQNFVQEYAEEFYDQAGVIDDPHQRTYGHNVFREGSLTFEPNENIATPTNYVLGPGDEVIIDIWGTNEDHIRQTISPEGNIMISQVGPVYLNGLTIKEANDQVKYQLSNKYAGISGNEPDSEVNVKLGQVRTIQVNIMGEANVPGTYRLSPFSNVFHALYKAGGVTGIGSIRNIEVIRNGRKIQTVDVYDYLFRGKDANKLTLREGDVIIVPTYEEVVSIQGNVKRPMKYELKSYETLQDLINYAGGFSGDAYSEQVTMTRQNGKDNELLNVSRESFPVINMQNGDIVEVASSLDRFANRVEVRGSVFRPGMFALSDRLSTVGELIAAADGLTEDAFANRVLIYRENPDLTTSVVPIDLDAILEGFAPDVKLQKNDVLEVKSIIEIYERGSLTIQGRVAFPGSYPYADNMTVEDLILMAGGLLQGASTAKIDVARRIIDPEGLKPTNEIAKIYTLTFKDGYVVDGEGFLLMPYDIVQIRKSPGYEPQQTIRVKGEVAFPGGYVLERRNERLSDIIKRAGGVNEIAYLPGAHILRKMTDEEIAVRNTTLKMAMNMENGGDSIVMKGLQLPTTYNIAIQLEKAMSNPGGEYDIIVKDDDLLVVPEITNTVNISGNVMFPNTVTYVPGKNLKYYIKNAGGYGENAKKNKSFIVYANGEVAIAKGNVPIEPGCQIIVPTKTKGKGVNWQAILTVTSALGSSATMAAALANLFK